MKFFLAFLLAAAPLLSSAEPLWGKLEAGASLQDIKSAYPGGEVLEPDEKNKMKNGAAPMYRLNDVLIADEKFRATFFLLNDKLHVV